jgi:hypothetical protein
MGTYTSLPLRICRIRLRLTLLSSNELPGWRQDAKNLSIRQPERPWLDLEVCKGLGPVAQITLGFGPGHSLTQMIAIRLRVEHFGLSPATLFGGESYS